MAVTAHLRTTAHGHAMSAVAAAVALIAFVVGPAPAAGTVTGNSPFGHFDVAVAVPGGVHVRGWVIDPDTTGPTYVWVTVDGVGRHLYANRNRPDVGAAYPAFGPNHGFDATLAVARGTHRICVTGHNIGPGSNTSLGCRNVNVIAPGSPLGNFEHATGVVGGIDIKGWVIDPDITGPTYAWVTVDGTAGRHVVANQNRPDVGAVFPGYGPSHGFRSTIPTAPGLHTLCVSGHNVGPGSHTGLGCRVAVAGSQQCPPFGTTGPTQSGPHIFDLSGIYGSTMRVGKHPCFERFVLEFAGTGASPDWSAFPTRTVLFGEPPGPIQPPVAGRWYLVIGIGAWITGEPLGEAPLSPDRIVTSGFLAIKEARSLGGFEGISELVIGVDNPRPYRVTVLENPYRLVVDVFTGIA